MTNLTKVYLNATRNSCRDGDEATRRADARRTVKLFLVPRDAAMSDAMVPNHLVTESMIDRFWEIEPPVIRCTTNFDIMIEEIERTYVLGAYFAALSGSVVAIERMLNTARIELHKLSSPKIKKLWGKGAITDWQPNIEALADWKYLSPTLALELSALYREVRCHYLHCGDIANITKDSLRAVRAAYELLNEFIGFPSRLFAVGSVIECLKPDDPLVQVFYR